MNGLDKKIKKLFRRKDKIKFRGKKEYKEREGTYFSRKKSNLQKRKEKKDDNNNDQNYDDGKERKGESKKKMRCKVKNVFQR